MTSIVTLGLTLFGLQSALAQRTDDEWLTRCERNEWDDRDHVCAVRVSSFRPGSQAIRVEPGTNGGVSIVGWDRADVEVHARIRGYASNRQDAREVADGVRVERNGNTVSAEGPDVGRREGWHVEFLVYVPRNSNLTLETHNGPLSVAQVNGSMDLHTINGPLSLSGVGGDVRARTSNGPLSIRLTGTRWNGAGLDAETSNGPVTMVIPENYSANLETGTVNGPMSSEFPLAVTFQGRMSRRLNTKLGEGGATIRAVTSNGPLALKRP